MRTLRGIHTNLEDKIQAERELSKSIALVTWEALEALEGAVVDLSALPSPRHHSTGEMDITVVRLCRVVEVCLPAAHAYGDHCMKVVWTMAFASLDKAGCGHVGRPCYPLCGNGDCQRGSRCASPNAKGEQRLHSGFMGTPRDYRCDGVPSGGPRPEKEREGSGGHLGVWRVGGHRRRQGVTPPLA